MKNTIILLFITLATSLSSYSQVTEPLYMYLQENHYPYNNGAYDSVLVYADTSPQSKLLAYASLEYMDVGNVRYISSGRVGDSANTYEYRSSSSTHTYSIFKVLLGSGDTVFSIHFYHDENGVDTASEEYLHQDLSTPELFSHQKYFYRQDGLLDSLHYEGFKPGQNLGVQTSTFFYSNNGQLDSVISREYNFGYRFRNIFVYDATGTLQYEDYYQNLGFGEQYFGKDIHRRNSEGQIIATERYIEVGGFFYIYEVHRYTQRPTHVKSSLKSSSLILYPNPTSNFLFLQGLNEGPNQYKIYNLLGTLIDSGELKGGVIDLRSFARGKYIIELRATGSIENKSAVFIKN